MKINVPKLQKVFEAAGLTNVWVDSTGNLTHENATPEQLDQAKALLEAHDPEPEPDEKRRQERRTAPEFNADNLTALVLEIATWAAGRGFQSDLATVILAKDAEIKQRHPDKVKTAR